MKITTFLLATMLTLTLLSGCEDGIICNRPNGPEVTQTLVLDEFSGIEFMLAGNVLLRQGSPAAVTVTGSQNMIDLLDLDVNNDGIWRIKYTECTRGRDGLDFDITIPDLHYIGLAGSGDITLANTFTGLSELEVKIAGSGDIEGQVEAAIVKTEIAGSGSMDISGTAPDAEHRLSGSGHIHCFDLISARVSATISGSGSIEVNASERLDATISGSGDIYYKGRPALSVYTSGSGNVIHRD